MREIKFRAWDRNAKELHPVETIDFGCMEDPGAGVYVCGKIWFSFDDIILEQFTGLKDKNGVEIYEGDIVVATHGYCGNPKIPTHRVTVEVKWGRACYDYLWCSDIFQLEVIGNIHENPELLKGEKRGESNDEK